MNLSKYNKIHFIGIGGIGMSALARFFIHEGKKVSGSDRESTNLTQTLSDEGIEIFSEQSANNITKDIDLVVYTEAMSKDHPEMATARELNVPMMNYFEALGLVANSYYLIAVAGTHGKTTTTAMLIDILEQAELDPTAVVGSLRSKTGSNFRAGKSKYFVVEACEYKRDFLHLEPDILVITNVELDHVDYFKNLEDVQSAFRELALKVPEDGAIIADTSDPKVTPVLEGVKAKVFDYREKIGLDLELRQPGMHNRRNAAAAYAAAAFLRADDTTTKQALESFSGTWRRFEYKGVFENGEDKVIVYDDYGHHPTEIKVTIAGTRELFPDQYLTVIFQSHTYTRTNELFTDFAEAIAKADEVILLPIYAAREEKVSGVSIEKLAVAINELGTKAWAVESTKEAINIIKNKIYQDKGGVVITTGAGDLTTKVAEGLVS